MRIHELCLGFVVMAFCLFSVILPGCDSGEKVVDKVTGKQDVEQFQEMKKEIGKIAEQQAKKYDQIPNDNKN